MHPREYVKAVLRTESNNFSNQSIIGKLVNHLFGVVNKNTLSLRLSQKKNIRLLHASVGIMTEVGELYEMLEKKDLDLTNLREEVGDSLWYVGVAVDELGLNFEKMVQEVRQVASVEGKSQREAVQEIIMKATVETSILLDLLKKSAFYGKSLDTVRFEEKLSTVVSLMAQLLSVGGFDLSGAMDRNIAKLEKRYGKKFTETAAVERDLVAERKILEQK